MTVSRPRSAEEALPSAAELRQAAALDGIDAATAWLYRRVLESPRHGPFIRRIDELCAAPAAAWKGDAVLVIVPGAFYREYPQAGADGRLVRREAERMGCPTELVPIASTGTLRQNARTLCDWLAAQPDRPVILASLCKGSADVKMALAEPDAERAFRNVTAWLSLGGPLDGTPLADWMLSASPGAVLFRLIHRLRGRSLGFLHDLRDGPEGLKGLALRLPAPIRLVSVLGFPLREHLRRPLLRRFHARLAPLGPNDGLLILADACAQPGQVYPIWGADHYLKPQRDVRPLVRALLSNLGEMLDR